MKEPMTMTSSEYEGWRANVRDVEEAIEFAKQLGLSMFSFHMNKTSAIDYVLFDGKYRMVIE